MEIDPNTKKIIVDEKEQTSAPNIYGIGDVIHVCLFILAFSHTMVSLLCL